jgi:pyruvate,water dikinase
MGWWRSSVRDMRSASTLQAQQTCVEAQERLKRVTRYHWVATMSAQLCYGRVARLAALAGHPGLETTVCGGYGTEELKMAEDMWALSRGLTTKERFLEHHGYNVPLGAELSAYAWREAPAAINPLLESYAKLAHEEQPTASAARRAAERKAAEAQILAGLSPWRRADARVILRMAREFMQLRTIGKSGLSICWDVLRAAARRLGVIHHAQGLLDEIDDIFHLTAEEVLARSLPADTRELVRARRGLREQYLGYRLPDSWVGNPEPIVVGERTGNGYGSGRIEGTGVSPGVVEGPVRVVSSPTDGNLKPGEILVCETTDPSWISLMVVAAGLVIDIGGPVSHGAIVARELGVPCVINTRVGTSRLRTGQMVRVDGTEGFVEILGDEPGPGKPGETAQQGE